MGGKSSKVDTTAAAKVPQVPMPIMEQEINTPRTTKQQNAGSQHAMLIHSAVSMGIMDGANTSPPAVDEAPTQAYSPGGSASGSYSPIQFPGHMLETSPEKASPAQRVPAKVMRPSENPAHLSSTGNEWREGKCGTSGCTLS